MGGIQKEIVAMINFLYIEYEVFLILSRKEGVLLENLPNAVHVIEIRGDSYNFNLKQIFKLSFYIYKIKANYLVSFMEDTAIISFFAIKIVFFLNIKHIISEHITLSTWHTFRKVKIIKKKLVKHIYQSSQIILYPGIQVFYDLSSYLDLKKNNMYYLPNYQNINSFADYSHQKLDVVREIKPFILFVGRICEQKGFLTMLKCLSTVLKNNDNLKLVVVGDGDFEYKKRIIDYLIEQCLFEKVIFLGEIDPIPFYKHARFLALFSKVEGNPRVIYEAMGCNCPVLLTPYNGSSIFKDNVFVYDNFKKGERKIELLITDSKERTDLLHRSAKFFKKVYSRENFDSIYAKKLKYIFSL